MRITRTLSELSDELLSSMGAPNKAKTHSLHEDLLPTARNSFRDFFLRGLGFDYEGSTRDYAHELKKENDSHQSDTAARHADAI